MTGTDAPLRDLIDAARHGDRAAQDGLFARYRNYLDVLARMSLPRSVRAKLDASDVVQDVLLKAHRGIGDFRGGTEEELVAWLRQILVRTMTDASRRFVDNVGRRAAREMSLDEMVDRSSQALSRLPAARGTSPSRGAQRREAGAFVADALAALKPDDREVIVLRSLESRDWADVGRRMNRTPDAARTLWGRAFLRLGALVEGKRWTAP